MPKHPAIAYNSSKVAINLLTMNLTARLTRYNTGLLHSTYSAFGIFPSLSVTSGSQTFIQATTK